MSVYGYIRKAYPIETMKQLDMLVKYECDDIFMEESDFRKVEAFQKLIVVLKEGDTVVLYNFELFGVNLNRIQLVIELFEKKKVRLINMMDDFDSDKSMDFYHHVILLVSSIKAMRSNQTKQVVEDLRKSGKDIGRPTISKRKIQKIQNLRKEQKLSFREISRRCDVSIGTVYKYAGKK